MVYPPMQGQGGEMSSPPPPPFPLATGFKPVQPVKGILRKNSNSVLRELTPGSEDPESLPPPSPSSPPATTTLGDCV
ncbi:hypothetical protein ACOMHN_022829 [Nucella lapillus]